MLGLEQVKLWEVVRHLEVVQMKKVVEEVDCYFHYQMDLLLVLEQVQALTVSLGVFQELQLKQAQNLLQKLKLV